MNPIVSRNLSVHKEHEVLLKLETAGLNDELAQKVIDSKGNELAMKVIRLITNGGFEPSTSQKQARGIMGKNFFGVEEVVQHFGINPSKRQLASLVEIPWSEETLVSVKDTHVLVAVFPLSILDIRSKFSYISPSVFYDQDWYNKQKFAKDCSEVSWQLIRKTPVIDSTSKTWDEQQKLLDKMDETPTAQAMIYTIIGHFRATGERLFEKIYVRTSSIDSDGYHVHVGVFDARGLRINGDWGTFRYDDLGLASARKF